MRKHSFRKFLVDFSLFLLLGCSASWFVAHAAERNTYHSATKLTDATASQDKCFTETFAEIRKWIDQKAFPGAVLAVGQHGKLVALKAFGKLDVAPGAPPMPVNAIFDLASLSKVTGTTTAAEILVDRKLLDLDAPVEKYLPEFSGTPGHDKILIRNLLTHSSGLVWHEPFWRQAADRAGIMKLCYTMPVGWEPGSRFQYSDYNMILLGEIVYRISGLQLDQFLAKNAFQPLGMNDTFYNPPSALLDRIPPTEQDNILRHRLVRGVVHDENAYLMGGVSGNAGLFSTASDLARIAQMYLNGGAYDGKRIVSQSTLAQFMKRQMIPQNSSRALGWDTPEGETALNFAGPLASPQAIEHTGFTGTSIYIDPERDAFIILLTNRVNPTRENDLISEARPAIHTAILATLDRKQ